VVSLLPPPWAGLELARGNARSERQRTRTMTECGGGERGKLLLQLFEAAVAAAHPRVCLAPHLPAPPEGGRLFVVGAGKAAAAMAAVAEAHYRERGDLDRVRGLATAPYGTAEALQGKWPQAIQITSARHPTPDEASVAAARGALDLAAQAGAEDLVLVLLSGGASALWAAPVAGVDLSAKVALTRGLLKSGADIHEMNVVRRHVSRIKGGRLRKATSAPMLTLAISDVPGDDPATIGSGPTVPDATSLEEARAVLVRRRTHMEALGLAIPPVIEAALADPANETPKPGDPAFATAKYRIVATPATSLAAAAETAARHGYDIMSLGDGVTGEAREVALEHARLAIEARASGRRVAILSGGELSVTVRHAGGRGGRSQEYALALALALKGTEGIAALAADTDGIDGGEGRVTDPAGAIVEAVTLRRLDELDARLHLERNDATAFFEKAGGLVVSGPTQTNVNDFRAILIDP
jgi:glycerate 2-kinase